jgi:hypothetical protein
VKLYSVEHGILVEPIGHLGAVFSHLDPFVPTHALNARSLMVTAPYMRGKPSFSTSPGNACGGKIMPF